MRAANGSNTFALLEVLPCVRPMVHSRMPLVPMPALLEVLPCVRPVAILSGVRSSYRLAL